MAKILLSLFLTTILIGISSCKTLLLKSSSCNEMTEDHLACKKMTVKEAAYCGASLSMNVGSQITNYTYTKLKSAITNPTLPFLYLFQKPTLIGHTFQVEGTAGSKVNWIQIYFLWNGKTIDNVALIISIRFPKKCIKLNSKKNGVWGREVIPRVSHKSRKKQRKALRDFFPFRAGKDLTVAVKMINSGLWITFNSKHGSLYKHRMSVSKISGVYIEGDFKFKAFQFH